MVWFNIVEFIMLIALALIGMKLAVNRNFAVMGNICYFITLFFFVAIPLLSEGTVLLRLENLDVKKIEETCSKSREEIKAEVTSPLAREMFLLAHRFDTISM